MTLSAQDKAVLKWFGLSVLIYLAVVDGGSVLYMIIATAVRGLIGYNGHTLPPETLEHPLSSFAQYVLSLLGFGVFFGLFGFLEIGAACASVSFFAFVYCTSPSHCSTCLWIIGGSRERVLDAWSPWGTWPGTMKRFGLQRPLAQ